MASMLKRLSEFKKPQSSAISAERVQDLAKFIRNNVKDQSFLDKIQYIQMRDGKLRIKVHILKDPAGFVTDYANEKIIRAQLLTKINEYLQTIGKKVDLTLKSTNGHSVSLTKSSFTSFTFTLDEDNIALLEVAMGLKEAEKVQIKERLAARAAAPRKSEAPGEPLQRERESPRGPAAGFFGATTPQPAALVIPASTPAPDGPGK